MQTSLFGRRARPIAAALLAGGALASAQAASVTLGGWDQGAGIRVATSLYTGDTGGLRASLSGAGAADVLDFVTYSVEIVAPTLAAAPGSRGTGYTLVDGREYFERRVGNVDAADRLGRLFTYLADAPGVVQNAAQSAALQEAIWNFVYDTDWTVTMSRSGFRDLTPGSRLGLAADLLMAGAKGVTESRYTVTVLESADAPDLLLVRPRAPVAPATPAVPLPGTAGLVSLAGLAALAFTRGRAGRRPSRR
jgi:hypothetical protein